ncbi:hypothetical protein [Stenotrophomonas maltophilia]|uniref:hypothetical protein n=1 Tax=Stenotrophomonas maltophilia TaxID=40324 RepID=UPI001655DFC3|nr:hypothetical protein [Stenotrophomonas maltophilia]MBC8772529.1 hypothetical protein [Stenotrophomonas maltophilia]
MPVSAQHVSKKARLEAAARLQAKLETLRLWSSTGIPARKAGPAEKPSLEWFPRSLRQFCAWHAHSTLVPLAQVGAFAFQTLQSHPDEKHEAQTLILALKKQAVRALEALDPENRIAALEAELKLEREKRAGALLGYRRARQEARAASAALALEQRAHQQTAKLLGGRVAESESARSDAEARVSALTKTLVAVAPIRRVK